MQHYGILCQSCGIEAPSKQAEFHQNIGALVMRFSRSVKGKLCKRCMHKHFWSMTAVTLSVGWLGYISLVMAPFIVLNNIVRYLAALPMPRVPAGARIPVVTDQLAAQMAPHYAMVLARLNAGEDLSNVVCEMAPTIGVTPGELLTFVILTARQQQAAPAPAQQLGGGRGFPVIMSGPPPLPQN